MNTRPLFKGLLGEFKKPCSFHYFLFQREHKFFKSGYINNYILLCLFPCSPYFKRSQITFSRLRIAVGTKNVWGHYIFFRHSISLDLANVIYDFWDNIFSLRYMGLQIKPYHDLWTCVIFGKCAAADFIKSTWFVIIRICSIINIVTKLNRNIIWNNILCTNWDN